jgi:hypothetical protein
LFLCLDGCNNFLDLLRFLLLRLFLLPWFFLNNVTMRWTIFNFNPIACLEAWSKLEGTLFAVNVKLDLPLANINGSSQGIEEMPPKDEWWLLPLSHLEYHEVDGDEVVSDLHGHIFGDAQGIANGVVTQLQTHTRRLQW